MPEISSVDVMVGKPFAFTVSYPESGAETLTLTMAHGRVEYLGR